MELERVVQNDNIWRIPTIQTPEIERRSKSFFLDGNKLLTRKITRLILNYSFPKPDASKERNHICRQEKCHSGNLYPVNIFFSYSGERKIINDIQAL